MWEGVGDRTELQYFDPPLLWLSALCLSRSPGLLNRRPRAHSAGFLYYILSATSLDPNSIGGPGGPFSLVWLSLPHLVSNFSNWSHFLSWLSYIIVQRPLNRPLNSWNGMFDRHQVEITVMQFRGHSLLCISLWVYHGIFLPCPISSAKHAYTIFSHNCHWNVSLPSGASPWNGKFGRVEGQNTTTILNNLVM